MRIAAVSCYSSTLDISISSKMAHILESYELHDLQLVLGDIRKIKTVRYCHKIPRYHGIVIVTKCNI